MEFLKFEEDNFSLCQLCRTRPFVLSTVVKNRLKDGSWTPSAVAANASVFFGACPDHHDMVVSIVKYFSNLLTVSNQPPLKLLLLPHPKPPPPFKPSRVITSDDTWDKHTPLLLLFKPENMNIVGEATPGRTSKSTMDLDEESSEQWRDLTFWRVVYSDKTWNEDLRDLHSWRTTDSDEMQDEDTHDSRPSYTANSDENPHAQAAIAQNTVNLNGSRLERLPDESFLRLLDRYQMLLKNPPRSFSLDAMDEIEEPFCDRSSPTIFSPYEENKNHLHLEAKYRDDMDQRVTLQPPPPGTINPQDCWNEDAPWQFIAYQKYLAVANPPTSRAAEFFTAEAPDVKSRMKVDKESTDRRADEMVEMFEGAEGADDLYANVMY